MTFFLSIISWMVLKAKTHWRALLVIVGILSLIILITVGFRSCSNKPKAVLNEAEIQKINQAIETKNRDQLENLFVEIETKDAHIAANTANGQVEAFSAIEKAKRDVKELSDEELAQYLESLK